MPDIHATALVGSDARLHASVRIGPYCIIEGPVEVGPGTRLIAHVHLQGPMTIGSGNTIYPFACLGFAPQDMKFDPALPGAGLVIGDGNVLREGVTIHRASREKPTRIGDRNNFMACSHAAHDVTVGDDCMFANSALVAGHAEIADRVIMAGNAGVQQFVRVGRLAMISGNEGISRDLPPFCMVHHTKQVGGLNLVGLRRAGCARDDIDELKQAFRILYRLRLTTTSAVQRIEEQFPDNPLCAEFARFVKTSDRGITQYGRWKG